MGNEIQLKGAQPLTVALVNELEQSFQQMNTEFTDYGRKCVINAIAGIVSYCKGQGIEIKEIDSTLLRLALQNVGLLELNYSAVPSEVYFDLRKNKDTGVYTISIKPQGNGNEKLVRRYGVGIKKGSGLHNAWLVREGDEFTYPTFNGLDMTPPKWTPKSFDKKVIMVVYPVEREDGRVEFLFATREGIKPNLIAQIRQNTLYAFKKDAVDPSTGRKYKANDEDARNEFYAQIDKEFEKLTVDEILSKDEYVKWINPTYSSGGSKEQMILRKMKNNALKNFPKEYDNALVKEAVENTFEDNDDSIKLRIKKEDVVAQVESEIAEKDNKQNAIADFDVKAEEKAETNYEDIF